MDKYEMVKAEGGDTSGSNVRMLAYEVYGKDKREALRRILHTAEDFYGLIFCARKSDVDDLAQFLDKKGFNAEGLHGDMSQPAREKVLGRLKKRKLQILVATDVAARGIDVNDLTYVINYDMPDSRCADSPYWPHRSRGENRNLHLLDHSIRGFPLSRSGKANRTDA